MQKKTLTEREGRRAMNVEQMLAALIANLDFSWESLRDYLYILVGALVQAFAMRLFLIPAQLVSGGISGTAQIINYFVPWPIGVMVLIGNIPIFFLGWRYLGGPRFALRTALSILAFSFFTDFLGLFLPAKGMVHDLVLNCLYGGVLLGIGLGLVYRGKGTSGGTDVLGRILSHRLGMSISQAYMATDTVVILAAGFVFGWENALYALVTTYVSGLAAEMALEGSDVFRTAIIISNCPDDVAHKIMADMERGVTILSGQGAYTGMDRPVLYCVISRSEVAQLKDLVHQSDPKAFMVIGQAHEALGEGFRPFK